MDVCLAASIISPGCDCHAVRSVDDFLHPVCDLPSFMRSELLQQQVALAVQLRLRDQSPSLMVQRPSQSVFPNWKQKDHVIVHRCHSAKVTKYPRQSANCLSRATVPPTFHTVVTEVVMNSCGNDRRICRVCPFCHNVDHFKLTECQEKWSEHANIS